MLSQVKIFLIKNHVSLIIFLIIILAAFLRLYRIGDYMTFLGDEGRDVLVVREILHGHFTLLGPRASAADFFTGPIYYYMMAPFLLLTNYNPVGPAIMIALIGIATVYIIYRIGKEWLSPTAGIIAATLYAVSPLVISYSRSSWNPNPMPFFSLLIVYLLYIGIKKPSIKKFVLVGILYGIAFQLHYIEIIMGVVIFTFVLFGNISEKRKKITVYLRHYLSIAAGFIIGFSPFLFFETRHGFPNTQTVLRFVIFGDPKAPDLTHLSFFQTVSDVFFRLFGRLILFYPDQAHVSNMNKSLFLFWSMVIVGVGIAAVISLFAVKDKLARLLLGLWLFLGVTLFAFYHKPIYDYYFEFMFPLPFLLVGNLFIYLFNQKKIIKVFSLIGLVAILLFNLSGNPLRFLPNRQYNQVKTISEFVLEKAGNRSFNFALITRGNSDHAYRYIFEIEGKPPVTILNPQVDPQRRSATDQLFVVCEENPCSPEGASLWEVAGFGRGEIAGEWPVSVVKVYKLIHYKGK